MKKIINSLIIFDILFFIESDPIISILCFIGLLIFNWEVLRDVIR